MIVFILIGVIHMPDGPFIRPHPGELLHVCSRKLNNYTLLQCIVCLHGEAGIICMRISNETSISLLKKNTYGMSI